MDNRGFWDFNNPNGFHRFVPIAYMLVVLLFALAFAVKTHDIYARRHALHCAYPLPGDTDICPSAPVGTTP